MVKHSGEVLRTVLDNFLTIAIENLQYNDAMPTTLTVCNNSSWFIGQVCASEGAKTAIVPFIQPISEKIVAMLMAQKMNKSVAMNVAIAFGRLGLVDAVYMARYLDNVVKQFALSI